MLSIYRSLSLTLSFHGEIKEGYGGKTKKTGYQQPTYHEGYYRKGKEHGPGIKYHVSSTGLMKGLSYEGCWTNGVPNGVFIQTLPNGDKREVCFKKGEHGNGYNFNCVSHLN